MKRETHAPLIVVIVLVLLPLLYIGSYFALVTPGQFRMVATNNPTMPHYVSSYRTSGSWPAVLFWPIEHLDRKMRPGVWLMEPTDP